MWSFFDTKIVFDSTSDAPLFSAPIFSPQWDQFSGQTMRIDDGGKIYRGYDEWVQHFLREDELAMVDSAIQAAKTGKRIHIIGISTHESVALIREYYKDKGYEDDLAKNYALPPDELLTVSISLPHALWCEKDKSFLMQKNNGHMYAACTPPLRSPADLRALQQALRMGIIMGLEVQGFEKYVDTLFTRQIISLYQFGCLTSTRWIQHDIPGQKIPFTFTIPFFADSCPDN